jgi:hypothetical protein
MTRLLARNLFHLMRGAAERTTLDGLKKKGHRSVSVLNFRDIQSFISRSIENTLRRAGVDMDGKDIQDEVRHEFLSLMHERDVLQNTVDAMLREKNELAANKGDLEIEIHKATEEFESARELFSGDAQAKDLQSLMEKIQTALTNSLGRAGVTAAATSQALDIVTVAIDEHRALLSQRTASGAEARLEQMQRRITKLKRKLEETEDMLARARVAGGPDGIEGEKVIPGVGSGDPNAAMKKELLGEIFKLNVELRQMLNKN